ncbi:MAG: hypothetical protein RL324_933 [Verrucomicrobiota bacterium]|jgi:hypothetical protein
MKKKFVIIGGGLAALAIVAASTKTIIQSGPTAGATR